MNEKQYNKPVDQQIIDEFTKLYYNPQPNNDYIRWKDTHWLGIPTLKCPFDLWIYQEIIYSLKPDIIIESGTFHGGSALYLATICETIKHGRIITIDVTNQRLVNHKRIKFLIGSSISNDIVNKIRKLINPKKDRVMVILDSDHQKSHVLNELKIYSKLVSKNSYLIVEDTCINHPILPEFGPGPMEAVEEFLSNNHDFIIDESKEKFLLTFNPKGYLLKVK